MCGEPETISRSPSLGAGSAEPRLNWAHLCRCSGDDTVLLEKILLGPAVDGGLDRSAIDPLRDQPIVDVYRALGNEPELSRDESEILLNLGTIERPALWRNAQYRRAMAGDLNASF
jgi:hypothetical protein